MSNGLRSVDSGRMGSRGSPDNEGGRRRGTAMTHTRKTRSNTRKTRWALAAAVAAAVPLFAATRPASAQYRIENDGRARDANNRLGSGGYNDGAGVRVPTVTANQI